MKITLAPIQALEEDSNKIMSLGHLPELEFPGG